MINILQYALPNLLHVFFHNIHKDAHYKIINVVEGYPDKSKRRIRIVNDLGNYANLPFNYFNFILNPANRYDDYWLILSIDSEINKIDSTELVPRDNLTYGRFYRVVPGSYDEVSDMISVYGDNGSGIGKYRMEMFNIYSKAE